MTRNLAPGDWEHHEKTLWPAGDEDHAALLRHIDDAFPQVANLIRRADAQVVVTAAFERSNGGCWGIVLIAPPRDLPFALSLSRDSIYFDLETRLSVGQLDIKSISFWRRFSERLGASLTRSGGAH